MDASQKLQPQNMYEICPKTVVRQLDDNFSIEFVITERTVLEKNEYGHGEETHVNGIVSVKLSCQSTCT